MTEKQKIDIAKTAMDNNMAVEDLRYSELMYGKEELTDDIWDYVEECQRIGSYRFYEKYQHVE